jgi:hypothetical protein
MADARSTRSGAQPHAWARPQGGRLGLDISAYAARGHTSCTHGGPPQSANCPAICVTITPRPPRAPWRWPSRVGVAVTLPRAALPGCRGTSGGESECRLVFDVFLYLRTSTNFKYYKGQRLLGPVTSALTTVVEKSLKPRAGSAGSYKSAC